MRAAAGTGSTTRRSACDNLDGVSGLVSRRPLYKGGDLSWDPDGTGASASALLAHVPGAGAHALGERHECRRPRMTFSPSTDGPTALLAWPAVWSHLRWRPPPPSGTAANARR